MKNKEKFVKSAVFRDSGWGRVFAVQGKVSVFRYTPGVDSRLFHYPEDHCGLKLKEFSLYVGPKSKIS